MPKQLDRDGGGIQPGPRQNLNLGASPPQSNRFPRPARLLRHAEFEQVYKQGRRHFSSFMTVFYLPRTEASPGARAEARPENKPERMSATTTDATPPIARARSLRAEPAGLRVGFTVGRALGGAVQRNRLKRRLREAVRLSRPTLALPVDVVINPKKSLLVTDFAAVVKEVSRAFTVIEQKLVTNLGTAQKADSSLKSAEARSPKPDV